MTLAHAFRHELKNHGIEIINFSSYLDAHPPMHEAEIKKGHDGDGTSWSCAHGVSRWKGGCDCGAEGGTQTAWRKPFRAALNTLRDYAAEVYETEGKGLLHDVRLARNDYAALFSGHETAEDFLAKHAARPLTREEKTRALKLLELQKHVNFMFTSCGWFFSDVSRVEAVQNLKYAARAVALLGELGFKDIEKNFLAALEPALSNHPDQGNARRVYENSVRLSAQTPETLAAFRLIEQFLLGLSVPGYTSVRYTLSGQETASRGGLETATGELLAENCLELETRKFSFLYARKNPELPVIWLSSEKDLAGFRRLAQCPDMAALSAEAGSLDAVRVTFDDLAAGEKAAVVKGFIRAVRHKNRGQLSGIVREYLYVFGKDPVLDLHSFAEIKREVELYAAEVFEILFDELSLSGDPALLELIAAQSEALKLHRLDIRFPVPPLKAADCALAGLEKALALPSAENLADLLKLLYAARTLNLRDAFFHLQNGLHELFDRVGTEPARWAPYASEIKALYDSSGIIIERFYLKLDQMARVVSE